MADDITEKKERKKKQSLSMSDPSQVPKLSGPHLTGLSWRVQAKEVPPCALSTNY